MEDIETRMIPQGFKVARADNGDLCIEYTSTGVRGQVIFLTVAVGAMTFGCAQSIYQVYDKYDDVALFIDAFKNVPWWSWGVFAFMAFFPLAFGIILLWFLFGRTRFRLSERGLWVQKRLFAWQRVRFVPAETMCWVKQEKDGGQKGEEDSYASWRLWLKAKQDIALLWKQPLDKSDWLGQVLAERYDIPFIPAEERE